MKAVFHLGQHAAVPHAKYAADKLPRLRKALCAGRRLRRTKVKAGIAAAMAHLEQLVLQFR